MNKYPIFYVVHARFFENSGQKNKKEKKITEVFENKKPKELRNKSLNFAKKMSSMILAENNAELPEYYFNNFFEKKNIYETSIEDVLFFETRSRTNLSLTLSFGIKKDSTTISEKEVITSSLPSFFPILAIGKSLSFVENSLKLGLLIERMHYEYYNQEEPKKHTYLGKADFLHKKFVEDVLIHNIQYYENKQVMKFIEKALHVGYSHFFPTFQFYKKPVIKTENIHCENTFFDNLNLREKYKQSVKVNTYEKQLRIISKLLHVELLNLREERLNKLLENKFSNRLPLFLVKDQLNVLNEISNEIKYVSPSEFKKIKLIKEWL